MGKILDLVARLFALVAAVFCVALSLAAFGYGNVLVMLWMVAGPILFVGSLALLAMHTAMRMVVPRLLDAHPSLFLALGLPMLGFVLLKLLAGTSLIPAIGVALLGGGLATVIPRLPVRLAAEISGLALALLSWFFDEGVLLSIGATACMIVLSVTARHSETAQNNP
ncbi:MAG: hypothetical protein JNJ60_08450 [Rhodocyclaceae bacterium]|nr:hypothetical protein [Rhodocyclaceae bacterium]